ncbi:MAG: GNAT family N-acetyltransferase [Candidatus Hodarchaeota archaeon]
MVFRPLHEDDLPHLHKWLNNPKIRGSVYIDDYPPFAPLSFKKIDTLFESWISLEKASEIHHFMIVKRDEDVPVGKITLFMAWDPFSPGIELFIAPNYQRQGFGRETLSLALDYLFNFTLAHVVGFSVVSWNTAAVAFGQAMVKQLDFTETGRIRRVGICKGQWYDEITYDILKREWRQAKEE